MGSWNKTCGLSNLHIYPGTKGYCFALIEEPVSSERCHSDAFWKPILLSFEGVYDDFGDTANNSFELDYVIQGIRRRLVEVEEGTNQYHDIAVTRDALDQDLFFEAIEKHRLLVKTLTHDEAHVDFVMFRKDVVDSILEVYEFAQYVGQDDGHGDSKLGFTYHTFADVIADIPEVIRRIKEQLVADDKQIAGLRKTMMSLNGLTGIFEYDERDKVIRNFLSQQAQAASVVNVDEIVVDLVAQGDDVRAADVLTSYVRSNFIDHFVDRTRKQWMPAGHEGDQNDDRKPYRLLCAAITEALDRDELEEGEW